MFGERATQPQRKHQYWHEAPADDAAMDAANTAASTAATITTVISPTGRRVRAASRRAARRFFDGVSVAAEDSACRSHRDCGAVVAPRPTAKVSLEGGLRPDAAVPAAQALLSPRAAVGRIDSKAVTSSRADRPQTYTEKQCTSPFTEVAPLTITD